MEQITSPIKELKKSSIPRLTKNSKLFKTIVHAIQEKKGENIVTLDLKKIEVAVADYFIVCDGRSNVNVKAICDFIVAQSEEICEEKPYHVEYGDHWTIIDYVNIVVHVFQHEQRVFYNLENLWADAPITELHE